MLEGFSTGNAVSFEEAFEWMMQDGRYYVNPSSLDADNPQIFDGEDDLYSSL